MKTRNLAGDRRRRKGFTLLWTLLLAAAVIIMMYFEMTALLYILATLGVTALLVIVAFSDLHYAEKHNAGALTVDDAAAIGSGIAPGKSRKS